MKARHGPDHPDVATALNNLAELLQATDRLAEAELLMRGALAIDEKSFGSTTWPRCCRPPTSSPRPNCLCAARSQSTRRASDPSIPTSRETSTTWPCYELSAVIGLKPPRWADVAAAGRADAKAAEDARADPASLKGGQGPNVGS